MTFVAVARRSLCTSLAIALAASSAREVQAAPAEPPPATDELAAAQALYAEGVTRYETYDYEGAVASWTAAYGKLPPTEENAKIRQDLVYNMGRALEKLYEQDKQVKHLSRAKQLLERYVSEKVEAGAPESDSDVVEARERIAALEAKIDEAERRDQPPPPREPEPKPVEPKPQPERGPKPGTGLIASGSVLTIAGVAVLAGGIGGGVAIGNRAEKRIPELDMLGDEQERESTIARGKRSDTILIACGVVGGVVALVGIALVAAGGAKRKKASRVALGPNGVGARF